MTEKADKHLTLRVSPLTRAQFKVACDLLEIKMSMRLSKILKETIKEGRAKVSSTEFESLVEEALKALEGKDKSKKTAGKKRQKLNIKRPKLSG